MGFLPIILLVSYLLNNNGNIKELLGGLDLEGLTPILSLLGADNKTMELLSSPQIKEILSGKADLNSLLPLLMSFLGSMNTPFQNNSTTNSQSVKSEYLNPIKDFANSEILSSLGNYFNS